MDRACCGPAIGRDKSRAEILQESDESQLRGRNATPALLTDLGIKSEFCHGEGIRGSQAGPALV